MSEFEDFLENYKGFDEIEDGERLSFLQFMRAFQTAAYSRETLPGHLSSSAWIVNPERTKILMIYHNLFKSWAWVGGHADGDENLVRVAVKETEEETGLKNIRLVQKEPIDINVLSVTNHVKRGKFVPRHLHYNVVYLFEADEKEELRMKPDENSGVQWIEADKISGMCLEDHVVPYYNRIMQKIKERHL